MGCKKGFMSSVKKENKNIPEDSPERHKKPKNVQNTTNSFNAMNVVVFSPPAGPCKE